MSKYAREVTSLISHPPVVTPEQSTLAIWLVRKYSSLTYIRRMSAIFANFVGGYEDFARQKTGDVSFYRENLARFYSYRALLAEGIDRIENGYPIGYASIYQGCFFIDSFSGRYLSEYSDTFEEIGYRSSASPTGLFAWADVATKMGGRVSRTVSADWPIQLLLTMAEPPFPPADRQQTPTMTSGARVETGKDVPASGIWVPTTFPAACPNYLWAGREAPPAERAVKRLDRPPFPGPKGMEPARVDYVYEKESTIWQLVWEDRRYAGGRPPAPEEADYLSSETDPPAWPPVQPPPRPE